MNDRTKVAIEKYSITKYVDGKVQQSVEDVSVERPLEIRIAKQGFTPAQLAITMRTPGQDKELALGFMYCEGIIETIDEVEQVDQSSADIIQVELSTSSHFSPAQIKRRLYVSSSCGACGKSELTDLEYQSKALPWFSRVSISHEVIQRIATTMNDHQKVFKYTGGLHAAALFKIDGTLVKLQEDVGRHNALDKLVGATIGMDLKNSVVMLSGRTSFELVQKAAMMGVSILVSIGPPSSLAFNTAEEEGITLIGFLKQNSMNVYTHPERVQELSENTKVQQISEVM